jgi:hypothetical protein
VSCLTKQRDNLLPAPTSMPRAVDEDIPTHHLFPFSLMVTSSFTWVNVFLSRVYSIRGGRTSAELRDGITYFSR